MSSTIPGISVVIPAMNAASTLAETLSTVLPQAHLAEVIVVVQPSSDGTADVARASGDPRVRVIEDEGRGISRGINIGIAAAEGSWFAKIDADDLVPEGRFAWQVAHMEASDSDVVAVCGRYGEIDERGRPIVDFDIMAEQADVTGRLRAGHAVTSLCTFLCRMSAVRATGGFRTWFTTSEDADFVFRLAEQGRILFVPKPTYLYRLNERSITHRETAASNAFYGQSASLFARQRRERGSDDLADGNPPTPPAREGGGRTRRMSVEEQAAGHLERHAWDRFARGETGAALRHMTRGLAMSPSLGRARGVAVMLLRGLIGGGRRTGG